MSPRNESLVQTIRVWFCVDDPLFNTMGATLSLRKRSARWAPSFCPLVRHLFGTTRSRLVRLKDDKESRCSHRRTLALNGARERLRHAIGSRVTSTVRALQFLAVTPNPGSSTVGFVGKPNKCEGILYLSLTSSVTPIAMSSRSPSLCGATVESTEF